MRAAAHARLLLLIACLFSAAPPLASAHARRAARHHHHLKTLKLFYLSGEISAANVPRTASTASARSRFGSDRPPVAWQDRIGRETTATVGLQRRSDARLMDRGEMNAAASSGRQPASEMVGVKLSKPF